MESYSPRGNSLASRSFSQFRHVPYICKAVPHPRGLGDMATVQWMRKYKMSFRPSQSRNRHQRQ
jgi:hypothetical protein